MKRNLRSIYEDIKSKTKGNPTLSILRREQLVENGKTSYQFDFTKKNANSINKTEVLLEAGEHFYVVDMAWGLAVAKKATPGVARFLAYPNPFEIAKANVTSGGAIVAGDPIHTDLEVFWNSIIKTQFEQEIAFERLHTSEFLVVPQTQLSAINDMNQQNVDEIFREVQPRPILREGKKNLFNLEIPSVAGMSLASNNVAWEIRAVLMARGFLVNASDVK